MALHARRSFFVASNWRLAHLCAITTWLPHASQCSKHGHHGRWYRATVRSLEFRFLASLHSHAALLLRARWRNKHGMEKFSESNRDVGFVVPTLRKSRRVGQPFS